MKGAYYIGFSPINGIYNENFFEGSITVSPVNEKGNVYYSKEYIKNTNNPEFLKSYRKFVYSKAKEIQKRNPDAFFLLFNDKRKIRSLCEDMEGINFIIGNDLTLLETLNNKFIVRNKFLGTVPTLKYYYDINKLNISKQANYVVQKAYGSGGNGTYFVSGHELEKDSRENKFTESISHYVPNIPLNITAVIGDEETMLFPISAQLIKKYKNSFQYCGGDFIFPKKLPNVIINKIKKYTLELSKELKMLSYRGIIGFDFILVKNDIYFLEINPRFQASSFIISKALDESNDTCLAEYHFKAITGARLIENDLKELNSSFLNSNYGNLVDAAPKEIVLNGYFEKNPNSVYRKVYGESLLNKDDFEQYYWR